MLHNVALSGFRQCRGSAGTLILVAVFMIAALSGAAYNLMSTSFRASTVVVRGTANAEILKNAVNALSAAAVSDTDGVLLPPAGLIVKVGLIGSELPSGGWELPSTLSVQRTDVYGTMIGYCVWNHGSSNTGSGYFTGQNLASPTLVVFAVISAGADKTFQTTCTQAKNGITGGDDSVVATTIGSLTQNNNGGLTWVDPVDCFDAATPSLDLDGLASGCSTSTSRVDLLTTTALASGAVVLAKKSGQLYSWYGGTWSAVSAGSGGYSNEGFLAVSFTPVNSAARSTPIDSNSVRLTGIGNAVLITINGGSYATSTDGSTWSGWQSSPGSVSNGQYLKLRQTSSASGASTTTATVNVGGVAKTWNVTTS